MINDFAIQVENQQHERELAARLEHRREAAEREVQESGGSRLAVMARRARQARARRVTSGLQASC